MRQVEISESALTEEGEDNTFVNPSLLLSQQPASIPSSSSVDTSTAQMQRVTAAQSGRSSTMSARNSSSSSVDAIKDSEADLMSIFQRKKSVTGNPPPSSGGPAGVAQAGTGRDSSIFGAFNKSRERAAPAAVSSLSAVTRAEEEKEVIDLEDSNDDGDGKDEEECSPLTITYSGGSGEMTNNAGNADSFGAGGYLPRPVNSMGPPASKPIATTRAVPATTHVPAHVFAPAPSFGLASSSKAAAFHVQEKVVRTKDSTIADYFTQPSAPVVPSNPSSQSTQLSQRPAFSQQSSQVSSQGGLSQPGSQRPSLSQPARNPQRPALDIPKFRTGGSTSGGTKVKEEQPRAKSFLNYLSQLDDEIQSTNDPVTKFHQQIGKCLLVQIFTGVSV